MPSFDFQLTQTTALLIVKDCQIVAGILLMPFQSSLNIDLAENSVVIIRITEEWA